MLFRSRVGTALIIQWDSNTTILSELQTVNASLMILNTNMSSVIKTQTGILQLLETAFEDSISGRELENGEL